MTRLCCFLLAIAVACVLLPAAAAVDPHAEEQANNQYYHGEGDNKYGYPDKHGYEEHNQYKHDYPDKYGHRGEDKYDKYGYKEHSHDGYGSHSYGGGPYDNDCEGCKPFYGNPANAPGTEVLPINQAAMRAVGKELGCAPIVYTVCILLTNDTDADTFVTLRQGVADKLSLQFPGVYLSYFKGAGPFSTVPYPLPGLQFWDVGVITVAPDAATAHAHSAALRDDPVIKATNPWIQSVVRVTNLKS